MFILEDNNQKEPIKKWDNYKLVIVLFRNISNSNIYLSFL